MDLTFYTDAIKQTMTVINTDQNSVVKNAEQMLKGYLETNTSITDNDRATIYAKFLTDVTTNAVTQSITAAMQLALDGAVNDQKVLNMQGELSIAQAQSDKDLEVKASQIAVDNQKIASMQADDTAKRNEVAAKVAKAKIEIEQLIPSQIHLNEKELQVKDKQLLYEDQRIAVLQKDTEIKTKQVAIEEAKIPLMKAQAQVEAKKVDLMKEQVSVEREKVPLMQAQAQTEQKKVGLMEVQIEQEREKLPLLQKQVAVETAKIPLMEAQANTEAEKAKLIGKQTQVESEKIPLQQAEVALRYADVVYRQRQAQTVQDSLIVNERIEARRNETQIKIATIQAAAI